MYDSEWKPAYATSGAVGRDYSAAIAQQYASTYPSWFPAGASGDGVWFVSAPISQTATQTFIDTYYTIGQENSALTPVNYGGSPPMPFFRAHITPANMTNIAQAINSASGCVPACYSLTAANYALQFAGVIAETRIKSEIREERGFTPTAQFDVGPSNWIANDSAKDQVSFGAHVFAMGVYRGIPQ